MNNLMDFLTCMRAVQEDRSRGLIVPRPSSTRDRITPSRIKEAPTHLRHIAAALQRASITDVSVHELTAENEAHVKQAMKDAGLGIKTIGNTMSTFRLARDMAIEAGVPIAVVPKAVKPKKGRIYRKDPDGRYRKLARAAYVSNNAPYGFRYAKWPERLKLEWEEYKRFHTDKFAEHRAVNILRDSTLKMRLNRFERMFGIELLRGVPVDELSFRKLADIEVVIAHRRFLHERAGGRDTEGMRGYLDQIRSLALEDFGDKALSDRISSYMKRNCQFEATKDKDKIVEAVHADDLHFVSRCLIALAMEFEANLERKYKYGRDYPQATMAFHWHRAAIWLFTITTLLRQSNVSRATQEHIFREKDGSWHYRFPAGWMKGDRPKADQMVDLWRGEESMPLIRFVMDKAAEARHFLVERFCAENPGQPEPQQFFLNMDGKGYTTSAMRSFFVDTGVAFLGPEKRFSQHDIRTIVASWLLVREGPEILEALRNHLHHKDISITIKYYIRVQTIFGARLAVKQMEERQRQRKVLAELHKLPDEMRSALYQHREEMEARFDRLESSVDAEAIRELTSVAKLLLAQSQQLPTG